MNWNDLLSASLDIGEQMQVSGAEIYRVEDCIRRICRSYGATDVDVFTTYNGEELVFEKGWFKVPVEEDVQKRANEASGRAYEAVSKLLYEETGMTMGEVVR